MMDLFTDLFTDYTLRTVAMGAALLGITAGSLGGFALLRRQSLLGTPFHMQLSLELRLLSC